MTTQTGVGAVICAAHRDGLGRLHGHTYEVVAWFQSCGDALTLQSRLEHACAAFDHAELLHELATGEGLVEALAEQLPDAIEITLSRHAERIFARHIDA